MQKYKLKKKTNTTSNAEEKRFKYWNIEMIYKLTQNIIFDRIICTNTFFKKRILYL